MPVKNCEITCLYGIPVKSQLFYLGVVITKDTNVRSQINFNPIIDKIQNTFNLWLQRDLSLRGRTLLAKALYVNASLCKLIDKMLSKFIWKNKTHYVKNCNYEYCPKWWT